MTITTTVSNLAALRALTDIQVLVGDFVQMGYRDEVGDQGGGLFLVQAYTASSEDGGIVFENDDADLLFRRQFEGKVNARWFGADPSPTVDNAAVFQSFLDFLENTDAPGLDYEGFIPAGSYEFASTLKFGSGVRVSGEGNFNTNLIYTGAKGAAFLAAGTDVANIGVEDDAYKNFYNVFSDLRLTSDKALPTISATITNATDNGGAVRITTSDPHGLAVGDIVWIAGVKGVPGANGMFEVAAFTATTFDLAYSTFTGSYEASGDNEWYKAEGWLKIENITGTAGGVVTINATNHGLSDNDWIIIGGPTSDANLAVPDEANGVWQVENAQTNSFDLAKSYSSGTAYTESNAFVAFGTIGFLLPSVQHCAFEGVQIGTGTRVFDVASLAQLGRRDPNPNSTKPTTTGVFRGDATLTKFDRCIFAGGGAAGVWLSGNGSATGTAPNREAFANMNTFVHPYFTNPMGNGLTLQRGVLNNINEAKFSACMGYGIDCNADLNNLPGTLVTERSSNVGVRFGPGSESNIAFAVESGGSNNLGIWADESDKNWVQQINGLANQRGMKLREDGDVAGAVNTLKRGDSFGPIWTDSAGRAHRIADGPYTFSGYANDLAASSDQVIAAFEVPAGQDLMILGASISTFSGGFVAGIKLAITQFGGGTPDLYVRSLADMVRGTVNDPIAMLEGTGGQKLYIRIINDSGSTEDLTGFVHIAFVQ